MLGRLVVFVSGGDCDKLLLILDLAVAAELLAMRWLLAGSFYTLALAECQAECAYSTRTRTHDANHGHVHLVASPTPIYNTSGSLTWPAGQLYQVEPATGPQANTGNHCCKQECSVILLL